MLYSIKNNEGSHSGIYRSFEDGMKYKWDDDCVVPVSDELARKIILGGIYDQVLYEYSEKDLIEIDEYGELQCEMFDNEVSDYVAKKRPGYELLLDYNYRTDNYFVG